MKFICISDTHGLNNMAWNLLEDSNADALLFAGDFSGIGSVQDAESFDQLLEYLPMKYKIVVAGNHDFAIEQKRYALKNCIYLEEESVVIEGIKIYGSPWSPIFYDWAFMTHYDALKERWTKIPEDTDILLTHSPPFETLDYVDGLRQGDETLADRLKELPNIKYHIFGHIHESYGMIERDNRVSINCSMLGINNKINKPIEFEV